MGAKIYVRLDFTYADLKKVTFQETESIGWVVGISSSPKVGLNFSKS